MDDDVTLPVTSCTNDNLVSEGSTAGASLRKASGQAMRRAKTVRDRVEVGEAVVDEGSDPPLGMLLHHLDYPGALQDEVSPHHGGHRTTSTLSPTELAAFLEIGSGLSSDDDMTPMHVLYPEFKSLKSFNELIEASTIHQQFDVARRAGEAAEAFFKANPSQRLSVTACQTDMLEIESRGLRAVVQDRSARLADSTFQPGMILKPNIHDRLPLIPPYPTPTMLIELGVLADGSPLITVEGFTPSHDKPQPPRERIVGLAIERLVRAEHDKGQLLVLPYEAGVKAFHLAHLPLHLSRVKLSRKDDTGRLTVDYTASGLNDISKKLPLGLQYGDLRLALPTLAQHCRRFMSVRDAFPGEAIILAKSDLSQWFRKIRMRVENVGLCAYVIYLEGVCHLVVPLCNQFGCQDSNYQSSLGGAIIAANDRHDDVSRYGLPLSDLYSDDDISFLPERLLVERRAAHSFNAEMVAGVGAINHKKDWHGSLGDAAGYRYDCHSARVALSADRILKLVNVLFREIPLSVRAGSPISVRQLQRTASYMIQTGTLAHAAAPFCRSLYANIAHLPHGRLVTRLSPESVVDINMWRALLVYAWSACECLSVHMSVPPLLSRGREELASELALRQAAVADLIGHGDAAGCGDTPGTFGCGFINHFRRSGEKVLWGGWSIPYVTGRATTTDGIPPLSDAHDTPGQSINFYEAVSMVIQLDATCQHLTEYRQQTTKERQSDSDSSLSDPTRPFHFHLWTDNSSALSWLTKYKALTPLNTYLLQIFSHLQARHGLLVTIGHIPGATNVLADAISRGWRVPHGDRLRDSLSTVPRTARLPHWWQSLVQIDQRSTLTTSDLDHAIRTTVE